VIGLGTRLLVAVGGLVLCAAVAVGVSLRQGTREALVELRSIEKDAADPVPSPAELASALDGRCCDAARLRELEPRLGSRAALFVLDADGRVVARAGSALGAFGDVQLSRGHGGLVLDGLLRRDGRAERLRLVFRESGLTVRAADGRTLVVHVVPLPDPGRAERDAAFLGAVDRQLVLALALVGVLALAVTWALARSVARPLQALRDAARALGGGALDRRVEPRGAAEVVELGRAFNQMADELQHQQVLRRDLVHDVAHELRTPLTALRCRVETLLDGLATDPAAALRDVQDEVVHLGRLVDDLQLLAQAEARELPVARERVAVRVVCMAAVRSAGLDTDPRVSIAVDEDLTAVADAGRLRQVLTNLLANASRHTPVDDRITLSARGEGDTVAIDVRNGGSRLDRNQQARVFDRLYRTDPARQRGTGGSGLGLAIVRQLTEAMGGTASVSSEAATVTFTIRIPAASASSQG
jgi:signal transduction histidine kinase